MSSSPTPPANSQQNGSMGVAVEHHEDGAMVAAVSGEVDLLTAPRFTEVLTDALDRRPRVLVVDLEQVDFLASVGLTALVKAHRRATELGTSLRVVATSRTTRRPIELTGLDDPLALYETREEALAA